MSHNFKTYLIIVASLLLTGISSQAQSEVDTVASISGIEIVTSIDRAEIFIGDLVTYKIEIIYDSTIELIPPPLGANLGAFDVKDYQSDMVSVLPDGKLKSESVFILSTFTTGDYFVPPLPVGFNMPDGSRKVMLSEVVPIKVKSTLLDIDDSTDIHPLKAQYEFKRDLTPYYLWGGAGLLVLIIAGWYLWWRRHRKQLTGEPIDLRPPWEIAFEKLAVLQQQNLIAEGQHKQYYFDLTEITREYLGRMFGINVLDMTTEEFLSCFNEEPLPGGFYEDTSAFLKHADLVKFAKLKPETGRVDSDFNFTHDAIGLIRDDLQRRQVAEAVESKDTYSKTSGQEVSL